MAIGGEGRLWGRGVRQRSSPDVERGKAYCNSNFEIKKKNKKQRLKGDFFLRLFIAEYNTRVTAIVLLRVEENHVLQNACHVQFSLT